MATVYYAFAQRKFPLGVAANTGNVLTVGMGVIPAAASSGVRRWSDGRAQVQPHGHRREERRIATEEEADGHGGEPGVGVRMDAGAHTAGHYGTRDKEEL